MWMRRSLTLIMRMILMFERGEGWVKEGKMKD